MIDIEQAQAPIGIVRKPAKQTVFSGTRAVRIHQLDIVELTPQPSNLVLKKLNPLFESYESPERCGCNYQNRDALSFFHISHSCHCCVYRKPRPGRSGDEVHQGSRVT